MSNEIKLLDASLLGNTQRIKQLSYWLKVMNRPNGWHYDLDKLWILDELGVLDIKPGSTVLDAGAGQGDMQYLLASLGYNVVSLDFSPRTKPRRSVGIFDVCGEGNVDINYHHPYMNFISYGSNPTKDLACKLLKLFSPDKMIKMPQRIMRNVTSYGYYLRERYMRNHTGYGKVTYLRAPFHSVPLESHTIDAVISVSAIEHSDIDLFQQNIEELQRVVKPGGPLLITTSASVEDGNVYDEKTSGWCFSERFLLDNLSIDNIEFDLTACVKSLKQSGVFRKRIDPYYYQDKESFCYKKRIESFPYLPVGLKLIKHNED